MAQLALNNELKTFFGVPIPPPGLKAYEAGGGGVTALTLLISNILKLAVYGAGLLALVNLIISGIQYIYSSGNPEHLKQASSRIWISLLGLLIAAAALLLAALFGLIFFKNPLIFIAPALPDPKGFGGI